jgi:hypothetical protein
MSVKITPFGPTQATLDEIARDVLRLTEVKKHLQKTRHRLLSVSLVESEAELKHSRLPATPSRFRATIYDYTNNRTLLVDGRLARRRKVEITDSASQPLPTREEFEEAVQILMRHEQLGPGIREQQTAAVSTHAAAAWRATTRWPDRANDCSWITPDQRGLSFALRIMRRLARRPTTRFADFLTPTRPPRATSLVRSGSLSNREAPRSGSSLPFDPAPRLGPWIGRGTAICGLSRQARALQRP